MYENCAIGVELTTTIVCADDVHPFEPVTITVYVPEIAIVELFRIGLSRSEINPFGPLQE